MPNSLPKSDLAALPTVEAPALVVAPEPVAQPTTTREENLAAQSLRTIAERSAPRTSEEDDRKTASQRVINLKWESTQQVIAIGVTLAVLVNCTYLLMFGVGELKQAAFIFLTNIAFLIIGTYFQRTNHTKSSGSSGQR